MMGGRHCASFISLSALMVGALAFFRAGGLSADGFDWRNVNGINWVSPVRDQFGGTCWDFAACGALEAKYMLTRDDNAYQPDVSEQQINWETSPDMGNSVNGGKTWMALDYITSHGVALECDIPYDPAHPDNRVSGDPWLTDGWQNRVFRSTSNYNTISQNSNLDNVKACLRAYGPMTIHLEVDNEFWDPPPGGFRGGHMVVVTGYQDDASVPGGGYWIVKNSWGASWNGDGYAKIAYSVRPSYDDIGYEWYDIFHLVPEYNRDVNAITGQVYFTGAMATVAWTGGAGTWTAGGSTWTGSDMYGNGLPSYAWENKETSAAFTDPGSTVNISGTVIAHGVTVNAGATGYVFNPVNNGVLTVTAGGINASADVAIYTPIKVGAPQSWNVASGKWLTVGDVHTIISSLTVNGPGWTNITGSLDGGGAANAGGMAAGAITISGGADLYLTGGGKTYDVNTNVSAGRLFFWPATGQSSNYRGVISGGGWIDKYGGGTAILSGTNNFSNWLSIYEGAVQADSGMGLPSGTFLNLNGGVLQSNGAVTFTRGLGTGGGAFQWNTNGGGFSAGDNSMTVNLYGDGRAINWGSAVGSNIVGTLKFGSSTANSVTTFQNGINLNCSVDGSNNPIARTINVEDNPNSGNDVAVISGVIANGSATSRLTKTGPGTLVLTGLNTYGDGAGYDSGATQIDQGALQADFGAGYSINSGLILNGGVLQSNSAVTFAHRFWYDGWNDSVTWYTGGFSAGGGKMTVNLYGDGRTLNFGTDARGSIAGTMILSSSSALYETEIQNGLNLNGAVRTIQVDDNQFSTGDVAVISGVISDSDTGKNGGITKTGPGRLILTGANTYGDNIGWLGFTTINEGVLQADRGVGLPAGSCLVLNGGVLQSNSETAFSTGFWYDWGFLAWNGGGFAAGGGKLTVNIYGDGRALNWGTGDGYHTLAGTMILGSSSAEYETVIQNGINLAGGAQTVQVNDNPNTTGDFANLSGVISDTAGGGSLTKTGLGELRLTGAGNIYTGNTSVLDGRLVLAKSSGYAIPGNLTITATTDRTFVILNGSNQIAPTSIVTFGGGNWPYLSLHGNSQTLGGISDVTGNGVIENTFDETDVTQKSTLTVNCAGDFSFNGYLRDTKTGTGKLGLTKDGSGMLTLSGGNIIYSGGTIVSAGNLVLRDITNAAFLGSGVSVMGTGILELSAANTDINFTGSITGTGAVNLSPSNGHSVTISGSSGNGYQGVTTISGGNVNLAKTAGYAIPRDLSFGGNSSLFLSIQGNNQIASSAKVTWSSSDGYQEIKLLGHNLTVAGISDYSFRGVIENTWDDTGYGASKLTVSNSNDCYFNGYLRDTWVGSGTLGLVKYGSGTLILESDNITYSGGTTIYSGTLQIGNGSNYGGLPAAGGVSVYSGGSLVFNRSDAYAYGGSITGWGTVAIYQGANGAALGTGYNTSLAGFSGTTDLRSGVLYLRSVNGAGTGRVNVGSGSTLALWTGAVSTFSNAITLNGIGGTNDGYAKPAIYGDGGSGTFTLSGQITLNATSDIGNYYNNGLMTLSGQITGPGGLVLGKQSPTLADEYGAIKIAGSANNDYAGDTTINRGTVYLAKTSSAWAIPGNVTIGTATSSATGSTYLVMNSGGQIARAAVMSFTPSSPNYAYFELLGYSLTLGGINDASGRGVIEHAESETNVTANSTLTILALDGDSSFNGYLRNGNYGSGSTGTLALVKNGTYKLTLAGSNCGGYTGGLTINEGTLDYSGGTLPNCAYVVTGGTLALGAKGAAVTGFRVTGGTVSGSGTLTSTSPFDIQGGNIYPVLAGGVALNKTGTGTATLYGATANSYSGGTTVSNGKLILAKTNNVAAIPGNVTINTTAGSNSYLMLGAANQIPSTAVITFAPSGSAYATLELGGKAQVLAGISDSTGRGVIENSETETGISANGVLAISSSSSSSFNGYIRNAVSGSTGRLALSKAGVGTLTLSGPNCGGFSGGLAVSGGTLDYSAGALPGFADGVYCNYMISGGTLHIGAKSQSIGTFNVSHPNALVSGTGTLTSNADYVIQAGTVNAVLAGNVGLSKTTGGIATVNAPTYTGTTTVSDGTLNFLGALPGGDYVVTGTGTLNINSLSRSIGRLQLTGGTINGAGVLTSSTAYDIQSGFVAPTLAGNVGLNKTGPADATISGPTYTGTTGVSEGSLVILGALPHGAYAISGGTLDLGDLSGSINGFRITAGKVAGTGSLSSGSDYQVEGGVVGVSLAGGAGLVKTLDGVAIVEGVNSFIGTTRIDRGILALRAGGRLADEATVENDGALVILDGTHSYDGIVGAGSTLIGDSVRLDAANIVQDRLWIGGDYRSLLTAGGSNSSQYVAVPEPSVAALMIVTGVLVGLNRFRRRR
jgi:autotransporter-associated beta strand protein